MPKRSAPHDHDFSVPPSKKRRDSLPRWNPDNPLARVPAHRNYIPSDPSLPPLPTIDSESLAEAPFRHKSAFSSNRTEASNDMSYERLEFLGDAYLEVFASRLIFSRFNSLPAGQMSQLRELLVKNETLAEYGRAYGFDQRVKVADLEMMKQSCKDKAGNKALNKVIGDVFEAYIAAIVLSKPETGFAEAEEWCMRLWESKIQGWAKHRSGIKPSSGTATTEDKLHEYNPRAKAELQQRILYGDVKLQYEPWKATVELKGDRIGQNQHFIALYLTGYGHERKLLGKGVGQNKVEAGIWAATEAMHGGNKALIDDCEAQAKEAKEKRQRAQAEKELAEKSSPSS
ncbi:hypothetical protein TI39_contig607g00014 [Zymoseptoria brevis]|uniref:RNase III domain-containing protein n=1 Tax=Zymoseptoria brevis TaxID=1047168 RepID=A0A0F4GH19_9PEZI|nr:hypothetical protein TI39_contig607g00014 [Zymoseptoria brevis]